MGRRRRPYPSSTQECARRTTRIGGSGDEGVGAIRHPRPVAAKDDLGRRGEELAAQFLLAAGYSILDRNWRCATGEIDVVARDGGDTVFVEVKTRSSTAFGHPFEAITPRKLARMRRLAVAWTDANPYRRGMLRLDAIAVIAGAGTPPSIEHLKRIG